MTDQMLEEVAEMLDAMRHSAVDLELNRECFAARELLTKAIAQIREKQSKQARAVNVAIELLVELRSDQIGRAYSVTKPGRDTITQVIALLDGSAEEGTDDVRAS